MDIQSLLTRLDEEALAEFLSASAFKVLKEFDPELVRLQNLVQLIDDKISKDAILRDAKKRNILFDTMNESEATSLLNILTQSYEGNPFHMLRSMSFQKNSNNEKKLFDFFKTEIPEEINLDSDDVTSITNPERSLFDHQHSAINEIKNYLKSQNRALLHMPTGSGKTRTAMRLVTNYLLEDRSAIVVWLAYSEELCEQAAEEFQTTWKFVGDRNNVKIIRFFRKREPEILKEIEKHSGIFLVAGLSKMYNRATREPNFLATLANKTILVVIDEAHQAIAETYKFVLEQLVDQSSSIKLLGLSATPGRTDDTDELVKFFKNKVTINKNDPVKFLINEGYLAKPDIEELPYDIANLSPQEYKKLENSTDIPHEILENLAKEEQRNIMIINSIEELIIKHRRIIVFGATVEHAQDIAIILSGRGHQAYYVTSETLPHIRKKIIEDFQNDDSCSKILCNFGVLTMGFDAPQTSAVVIARPTKSLVLYAQMIGRAIRGVAAGGNKTCSIRTVVDSNLEKIAFTNAFYIWDEKWKEQE